ncbi:proline-rich protein HaeIII subfamily 1-like [Mustela putorius furo]|uniref:Proline-rich protein HaeIII subfamily 1-like n=1 Tax=Mustela putorius furo TaxID=9669 RepID=A0A8U0RZK3_MUSPF|nr:proline-rich protein HaeIII subfamily 1-like [Mustela putorius furo]
MSPTARRPRPLSSSEQRPPPPPAHQIVPWAPRATALPAGPQRSPIGRLSDLSSRRALPPPAAPPTGLGRDARGGACAGHRPLGLPGRGRSWGRGLAPPLPRRLQPPGHPRLAADPGPGPRAGARRAPAETCVPAAPRSGLGPRSASRGSRCSSRAPGRAQSSRCARGVRFGVVMQVRSFKWAFQKNTNQAGDLETLCGPAQRHFPY